jgi:hypothetical protein
MSADVEPIGLRHIDTIIAGDRSVAKVDAVNEATVKKKMPSSAMTIGRRPLRR